MFGFLSRKNHFPVDGRTILITGASQGMGKEVARILAQKGANVVVVARDVKKLESAINYISSAAANPEKQRFHSISADVTKAEENTRIIEEVTAWNHGAPPDIVWAIAGASIPGLFIDTSLETLHSQMDINYWSAAYLSQAVLKLWLRPEPKPASHPTPAPSRRLIMTSSVIAFVGLAGYAPYGPCKAAMRSLADALRSELHLYRGAQKHNPSLAPPVDVKVHCVCPGTILSPGLDEENKHKHPVTKLLEKSDPKQTAEEVAEASIKALEGGHFLIVTQWLAALMRAASLQGSERNSWLTDTLLSFVASVVWLFVGPDLDKQVLKYGQEHGVSVS
ncbi:NAD(P)-binding protein [Viridothelium virens]|uniref:3-dehydrosphinganine reductase n=1 Tax=Viridothelium virens TaxID=1048519 RepID=A0A6A6HJ96_VIRVR|nr:NAD(P)-binding protein [Viridothelium virens]